VFIAAGSLGVEKGGDFDVMATLLKCSHRVRALPNISFIKVVHLNHSEALWQYRQRFRYRPDFTDTGFQKAEALFQTGLPATEGRDNRWYLFTLPALAKSHLSMPVERKTSKK
jgi:hypothetical protein